MPSRIEQEKQTVERMVRLYCRKKEGNKQLCPRCEELLGYARIRLSRCPFGENKSTCRQCSIHCYKPEMKDGCVKHAVWPDHGCCCTIPWRHSAICGRSMSISISPNVSESRARNSTNNKPYPGRIPPTRRCRP
mgnify:CR=1 FL=1